MLMRAAPFLSMLALPLLFGCPKQGGGSGSDAHVAGVMSEKLNQEGVTEQAVDINGDGKADVVNFMRDRTEGPRQIVARDSDVNWDGRFDVRSTFSEQTGQLEREEMDGDFDGRVDWIDHYQGGRRVLSEVDADNDGKMDLFKIFENGKLRRKERDTNADGKIDFWEYLDESGNVVKVGRDVDGDGVMDVRND